MLVLPGAGGTVTVVSNLYLHTVYTIDIISNKIVKLYFYHFTIRYFIVNRVFKKRFNIWIRLICALNHPF